MPGADGPGLPDSADTVVAIEVLGGDAGAGDMSAVDIGPQQCPTGGTCETSESLQWCIKTYPSGTKVAHGAYKTFHPNGQVASEGCRWQGRRLGPWKFWFATGKPQGEEHYDGFFRLDGPAKQYSDKGTLTLATTFDAGKIDGDYLRWWDDGKKRTEQHFVQGKADGDQRAWFENGQPEEEGKSSVGKNIGAWTGWYANGQKSYQGSYDGNGLGQGGWTWWNDDGTKAGEATFKDGTGSYVLTGKTGKKTRQAVWVGGKRNGIWLWWYDSGNPFQKVDFQADAGPLVRWFDQAGDVVMAQTGVKDGSFHGPYQENYLNGQAKDEAIYVLGRLHGTRRQYSQTGKLQAATCYFDDVAVHPGPCEPEDGVK